MKFARVVNHQIALVNGIILLAHPDAARSAIDEHELYRIRMLMNLGHIAALQVQLFDLFNGGRVLNGALNARQFADIDARHRTDPPLPAYFIASL